MANDAIPNLAEEDNYKKRYHRARGWLNFFIVVSLVFMTAFVLSGLYIGKIAALHTIELTNLETAKKSVENTLELTHLDYARAKMELEVVMKRMENIKTSDDFLTRDIELYIQARYRRVPKSVAKVIASNIVRVCKEEDVAPAIVVGIIEIESQFIPTARNEKSKAIGLMQIMHEWVKKLGLNSVYDLYDIPTNIESGVKILKIHIYEDGKGDISKGLYFYVGKDKSYAAKVFQAAGKFVVFRSTIDDEEKTVKEEESNGNGKEEKKDDVVEPAKTTDGQHSS